MSQYPQIRSGWSGDCDTRYSSNIYSSLLHPFITLCSIPQLTWNVFSALVAAAAHAAPFFRAAEAAFLVPTLLRNVVVVDEVAVIGVVEEDYSSRHSIALALGNPQGAVDVRPLIVRRVLHRSARFPAENALLRNEGGIVSNTAFCCPSLHRSQNQSPSGMPLPSDDPFP